GPTTLLTRVTRIFQKNVFTETTPAARTGHRAGLFVARRHVAAAARRQRTVVGGGSRCKPPVVETTGHCFRPVIYNENTYHRVSRRKRPAEVPARKTFPSCPANPMAGDPKS